MTADLKNFVPRARPARETMEGRFVRLEPLDAARHGDDLYAASTVSDADRRFTWLPDSPPKTREEYDAWLAGAEASADPLYFAVVDRKTGKACGRQTFMRIDQKNGGIEIGNVYWGPLISRTPMSTEALYLFARRAFDDLGYRRFEWKCDHDNAPSERAAERFGFTFEGVFRQHLIVKGKNRDTAWFSMVDSEWPLNRKVFEGWLDPSNFDSEGRQKRRLEEIRADIAR
ncbi:MAG: GNAT family N-acetyltransferase [Hyphomicrobiales bacterium]|nr:GNAT family N-acetyltransferase [Hyphomicrobiales bacterium]